MTIKLLCETREAGGASGLSDLLKEVGVPSKAARDAIDSASRVVALPLQPHPRPPSRRLRSCGPAAAATPVTVEAVAAS